MLDVKSAYDNVKCDLLIKKLFKMECPSRITGIIQEWFRYREGHFLTNNGEEVIRRRITKGLPQGAVLSPTLYDIYTEDLVSILPEGVKALQFADDIGIYASGPKKELLMEKIIRAVKIIKYKLVDKGLELQMEKTDIIMFSDSIKNSTKEMYNIDDLRKEMVEVTKFLGIWLDAELNFRKQIEAIKSKITKANRFMRFMMGIKWGVECDTALMLYKNMVRSLSDYGLFMYFPWEAKSRVTLERTQYSGLRIALGYRMSTPTNVILAEAKELSIEDRAGMLARRFVGRIYAYGEIQLKEILQELANTEERYIYGYKKRTSSMLTEAWVAVIKFRDIVRREDNYCPMLVEYWSITNKIITDKKIGRDRKYGKIKDNEVADMVREKFNLSGEIEMWFTDGSKKEVNGDHKVGIGVYREDDEDGVCCALNGHASIFTAELAAIYTAIKLIMQDNSDQKTNFNYVIASDSESAISILEHNDILAHNNPYVYDIRKQINKFQLEWSINDRKIILMWIPAHIGVRGNEVADWLANQGTQEIAREEYKIPVDDFKQYHKEEMQRRTKRKIVGDSKDKGKFYFDNFYEDGAYP